jgi:hypothetical protein
LQNPKQDGTKVKLFLGVSAALIGMSAALSGSTPAVKSALHPIVDPQSGYLIGGSKNGKWVTDKETAKSLTGADTYRVLGHSTPLGQAIGSKARTGEAPCSETFWVNLSKNFNGQIAVSADWNPVPRHLRVQNPQQKFYRSEVARVLRARGIKNPKVRIAQLWRVDLDGDGTDEVLLLATNHRGQKAGPNGISSASSAGDYSLALLRKIVDGKVRTLTLAQEIYPQAKTFNAPNVFSFAGVYDLNGDGKMEIVLRGRYYEGDWMSVYEVRGAGAREVLSSGCGA